VSAAKDYKVSEIMPWRRYGRSIFDEIDEMRTRMDQLFENMSSTSLALPSLETGSSGSLPAISGEFRVDVSEDEADVIITADMIPGVEKEEIRLELVTPRALEISCERKQEKEEEKEGYFLRERSFGSVRRIVPLPRNVTPEGSTATFRNGVLEVRMPKTAIESEKRIAIE